jgi:hypothetical protein
MIDIIYGSEHEVIAILAYQLWERRGCPLGSPEVDWFEARNQLAVDLVKSEFDLTTLGMGMEASEGPWGVPQD